MSDEIVNTDNEETNELGDEIFRVEKILEKIENHINDLWDDVLVPYMNNTSSQILTSLTEYDRNKFYKFMINNNIAYNDTCNYLMYLNNLYYETY
jgi:vacuolar-type H+-ATPase subunit D/Vma8